MFNRDKARSARSTHRRATARDVAKLANVSTATVSRVLNQTGPVIPELRVKVEAAMASLDYTPHPAARALASQKSMTIGAVIPSIENINFSKGVAALQREIGQSGYTLLLGSSNYDRDEEFSQVQALVNSGIAGLLLVGQHHHQKLYELLEKKRIPFVNAWTKDEKYPYVGFDNVEIGHTLVQFLYDLGHRDFGVIMQSDIHSDRANMRLLGIREALKERKLNKAVEWLITTPYHMVEGQRALREIMEEVNKPTAIICGTDYLAIGALVEANRLGIKVPEDLSITGINDIDFAAYCTPPLTTIRVPASEIGSMAGRYLVQKIKAQEITGSFDIPVDLIVRKTTSPPKSK